MNTVTINLWLSTLIFYLAYCWMLKPTLFQIEPGKVLIPLLLLQSMRHLGVMFLTTGVTAPDLPQQFAMPAAAGDFLSSMLALIAAVLVQRRNKWAIPATWTFSLVGSLDTVMAITLTRIFHSADFLGAAYWIPAFWVPLLIVGHGVIFKILLHMKREGLALQ